MIRVFCTKSVLAEDTRPWDIRVGALADRFAQAGQKTKVNDVNLNTKPTDSSRRQGHQTRREAVCNLNGV